MLSEEEIKLKIAYLEGYLEALGEGWGPDIESTIKGEIKALKEVLGSENECISI